METLLPLIFIIILIAYLREKYQVDNKYYKEKNKERYYQTNNYNNTNTDYKKIDYLLTPGELKFYKSLLKAIEDTNLYICPKVRLADIVIVNNNKNFAKYFNKIKSKHIDFILCDKKTMSIIKAIELDDKSHLKSNRLDRDMFINKLLNDVGIPILRYKASYSYDIEEIKNKLKI